MMAESTSHTLIHEQMEVTVLVCIAALAHLSERKHFCCTVRLVFELKHVLAGVSVCVLYPVLSISNFHCWFSGVVNVKENISMWAAMWYEIVLKHRLYKPEVDVKIHWRKHPCCELNLQVYEYVALWTVLTDAARHKMVVDSLVHWASSISRKLMMPMLYRYSSGVGRSGYEAVVLVPGKQCHKYERHPLLAPSMHVCMRLVDSPMHVGLTEARLNLFLAGRRFWRQLTIHRKYFHENLC